MSKKNPIGVLEISEPDTHDTEDMINGSDPSKVLERTARTLGYSIRSMVLHHLVTGEMRAIFGGVGERLDGVHRHEGSSQALARGHGPGLGRERLRLCADLELVESRTANHVLPSIERPLDHDSKCGDRRVLTRHSAGLSSHRDYAAVRGLGIGESVHQGGERLGVHAPPIDAPAANLKRSLQKASTCKTAP